MSDEKTDDVVVEAEDKAPEVEVKDDKPAELSAEDALAELQRKLEAAEATAKAANERAQQAERQAAEARNAASDTDLQLVIGAIDSVKRENEIAKANYRAAMSTGDYDRAAEYQEMLSTNAAKLLQLENGRVALENKPKERPVPADPVEAFAAQLTPRSADWIRQHPQCVTDPRLQQKMIAAHNLALADGIRPDTDEYFAAVEGTLGMKRAVEAPLRNIASNAGVEGSIIVQKVKDAKDANFGYNASTDEYEDMVKAGVIDPTKVVRSALQNASSIASLLLTTEAMVSEIPEEKKEAPAAPGGGMGGMY